MADLEDGVAGAGRHDAPELAPAVWHWTWTESTRHVLASVEASVAPVAGVEADPADTFAGSPANGASTEMSIAPSRPRWTARQWLVGGWLGGALVTSAWLAWGFGVAARWRRQAVAVDEPDWLETLQTEATALGVTRLPRLAVHAEAPGPCLIGVGRQPTLVLPAEYREWDADTRRAVVRHELAHVVGRDGPFAVFRCLVLALQWPNPLAWVAAAKDRREQELAADRLVLASGIDAGTYASLLLHMARKIPTSFQPASCHSMASLSNLEGRFRAILDGSPSPIPPKRWLRGTNDGETVSEKDHGPGIFLFRHSRGSHQPGDNRIEKLDPGRPANRRIHRARRIGPTPDHHRYRKNERP